MLKIIYILFASLLAFNSNSNVIEKSRNSYFLTKVLSQSDLKIYKHVILYQKKYQWEKADRALLKVKNPILVGHFQYEKLMHPNKYKASYKELSDWFRKNIDYPPVLRNRIYYLLIKRLPDKNKKKLYQKPLFENYLRGYGEDNHIRGFSFPIKNANSTNIKNKVSYLINEGKHSSLINLINGNINDDADYLMHITNQEIKKIFFKGDIYRSMKLFDMYINSLDAPNPDMLFRAGINAYRLGSFKKAKSYFNECNRSVLNYSKWLLSGCAYWESLLEDSEKKKSKLLKKASKSSRTIYGQLAIEQLNISDPFTWRNYANQEEVNFSYLNENKIFKRGQN